MSICFPKILNGRMENKVQQLFLGKYFTQMRTALLKKALTQIRTALPQKTNRVQSSLHCVNVFFTCFQTLRRLRKNVAFYTKQDFSAISYPHPTLSTVECSLGFQELLEYSEKRIGCNSNSLLPSQERGFLHKTGETGFLRYKFSTSHFVDGRVLDNSLDSRALKSRQIW